MDQGQRELWQAADALLDQLLDLAPEQRLSRLQQLTQDPALEACVRQLLAGSQATGPLDQTPAGLDQLQAWDGLSRSQGLTGRQLGRWLLHECIGEGGTSVVYRATSQLEPLDQQAAVKILSLGAVARGGHERFLREQSVLARLRHPYIAPLYEAGVGDDGTPWLAMALVEGERIDQWCSRHQLDLGQRLDLIEQVAQALAHAHRHLVVHRDLKPSNVLVDEDGKVRLLDFGIGRELAQDPRTRTQLRSLTPEYAAPEQFVGNDSGTLVDVYGLAALTYRLLTGSAPHLAITRSDEAPEAASVKARRQPDGTVEQRFSKRLRGDIDAILAKALDPEPAQRYSSVEHLVDDLRRHRACKPVIARAARRSYRLRRFLRRHRWPLAATAVVMLSLLVGGLGVYWQARQAQQAAEEARLQLEYLTALLGELAPSTAEAKAIDRSRLIASAASRARTDLASQPALRATLLLTLGEVAQTTGDLEQARDLAEEASQIRGEVFGQDSLAYANALVSQANAVMLGNDGYRLAEPLVERSLALYEQHAPESEGHIEALAAQLTIDSSSDRLDRSAETAQRLRLLCQARAGRSFKTCSRVMLILAQLPMRHRDYAAAELALREAIDLLSAHHGPDHVRTLAVRSQHAVVLDRLDKVEEAAQKLEVILAAQQSIHDRPTREQLSTQGALAETYTRKGEFDRARQLHEATLEGLIELVGPGHAEVCTRLANYGVFLFKAGDFEAAAARLTECAAGYATQFGADHAGVHLCNGNRADVLREMGRLEEARPLSQAALEGLRRVLGEDTPMLAPRYSNLARIERARGNLSGALPLFEQARDRYLRQGQAAAAATMQLRYLEAALAAGKLEPEQAWAQAQAARSEVEAAYPPGDAIRASTEAPYLLIACNTGVASRCQTQREHAQGVLATATTAADTRNQIRLALHAQSPVSR